MTPAEFRKLTPEKLAEFVKADPNGFLLAHQNAEGEARGTSKCPGCGNHRNAVPFHQVTYTETAVKVGKGHVVATMAMGWMCEACWQKSTVEERLAHHDATHEAKLKAIPSIVARSNAEGGFSPCPKDTERFEQDKAKINEVHSAIREIVKAGNG